MHIHRISIEGYKSIRDLKLELGRVNVFIGQNGAGKSTLLEACELGNATIEIDGTEGVHHLEQLAVFSPMYRDLRGTFDRSPNTYLDKYGERFLSWLRGLPLEEPAAWLALQRAVRDIESVSGLSFNLESGELHVRDIGEGGLHALFCLLLVISARTTRIFAIENVHAQLGPSLARTLTRTMVECVLARDKQVLLTTHNPFVLDGLNLHDERQRLFVVARDRDQDIVVRRVRAPVPVGNDLPVRLSDAFAHGILGV